MHHAHNHSNTHPLRVVSPSLQDQSTPLHLAADTGHTAVVELLLQRGANSEAVDKVRTCRVDGGGMGEECEWGGWEGCILDEMSW